MVQQFLDYTLQKKNGLESLAIVFFGLLAVFLLGWFDFYIVDINLFIVYTVIVIAGTLLSGTALGISSSLLSSLVLLFVNQKEITADNGFVLGFDLVLDFLLLLLIVAIVFQLKAALLREHRLARQDPLTGLGNRRAFMETLKDTNGQDMEYSLCYIDIEEFNTYLESQGVPAAEKLVKKVAQTIRTRYPQVFRYEEDRFTLLFAEADGETAFKKMTALRQTLNQALAAEEFPVRVNSGLVLVPGQRLKMSEVLKSLFDLVNQIHVEGTDTVQYRILTVPRT